MRTVRPTHPTGRSRAGEAGTAFEVVLMTRHSPWSLGPGTSPGSLGLRTPAPGRAGGWPAWTPPATAAARSPGSARRAWAGAVIHERQRAIAADSLLGAGPGHEAEVLAGPLAQLFAGGHPHDGILIVEAVDQGRHDLRVGGPRAAPDRAGATRRPAGRLELAEAVRSEPAAPARSIAAHEQRAWRAIGRSSRHPFPGSSGREIVALRTPCAGLPASGVWAESSRTSQAGQCQS